jgi:hypothetical protein
MKAGKALRIFHVAEKRISFQEHSCEEVRFCSTRERAISSAVLQHIVYLHLRQEDQE